MGNGVKGFKGRRGEGKTRFFHLLPKHGAMCRSRKEALILDEKKTKYDGRKNLIPASRRSPEERRELGRKGGLKAQECNKERRNAQEIMRNLLNCKIDYAKAKEKLGDMAEYLPEGATLFDMISLMQVLVAGEGSPKAFEVVRDTAGYKPVEQIQTDVNIMTDQDRALLEKVAKRQGLSPEDAQ